MVSLPIRACARHGYPQAPEPYAPSVTKPTESSRETVGLVTLGVAEVRIAAREADARGSQRWLAGLAWLLRTARHTANHHRRNSCPVSCISRSTLQTYSAL